MDTDSDTDISDRPPVDLFVEEGELSDQDLEASAADPDLTLSEEQNYRETMSGIRLFMGWTHIPEIQQHLGQRIIPSRDPRHNPQERFQFPCRQMNGYVARWVNSISLLQRGTRRAAPRPVAC